MTMKLWGDGVATNAMFAAMGDKENLDTWNTLVKSLFCLTIITTVE